MKALNQPVLNLSKNGLIRDPRSFVVSLSDHLLAYNGSLSDNFNQLTNQKLITENYLVCGLSTSLSESPSRFHANTSESATALGAISIQGTSRRALMLPA